MIIPLIGTIVISFLLTKIIFPMISNMLYEGNCTKSNYTGEIIPVCSGLVFIPVIAVNTFISILWLNDDKYIYLLVFFLGTLAMGFAGLIDDVFGNRNVTGLKGHLRSLLKGNLTTGAFKALFGGLAAFIISLILSNNIIDILINTIIIALFTNTINLLDLRPGRAIKGFLLFTLLLLTSAPLGILQLLLYGLSGSAIAYLPYDLKAKSMLGDVGSNILGISLGIICAVSSFNARIAALILLILFHLYTEKYSLTDTIEKNKVLKYFDQFGR